MSRATVSRSHGLVAAMLAVCPEIHCLRDATRGGVATVLNEFAQSSNVGIRIREDAHCRCAKRCKGACEILGLDPLYLANEGKLVAVVPAAIAERVLAAMRAHPAGRACGDHRRSAATSPRASWCCIPASAASASSTCWSASSCRDLLAVESEDLRRKGARRKVKTIERHATVRSRSHDSIYFACAFASKI